MDQGRAFGMNGYRDERLTNVWLVCDPFWRIQPTSPWLYSLTVMLGARASKYTRPQLIGIGDIVRTRRGSRCLVLLPNHSNQLHQKTRNPDHHHHSSQNETQPPTPIPTFYRIPNLPGIKQRSITPTHHLPFTIHKRCLDDSDIGYITRSVHKLERAVGERCDGDIPGLSDEDVVVRRGFAGGFEQWVGFVTPNMISNPITPLLPTPESII